ncbi:quinol:cytochrome c oxidoreductase quinone-binding subunit 2 [Cnuella takakiae]|uniref:Quinol:cytochrome c oxidoreductase quinone-binding subunit 2 n=1 Tax=Cnuella takakiae TaxID=1302690 RepID=A0A1M5FCQ1_9BACT|nr:quinol:cytochrome C oxidoreductase [Cnuella takakiae]OLY91049.1 quinol:cytochrome C oxidoreductase [Cnuella takakiae]SHF88882.1 quinol:cytochrome c oxidoreductase quinone-binding subunit 2 [Cnuella takakiae]
MASRDQFVIPKRYNTISLALMGVGIVSVLILLFSHGLSNDEHEQARFWASLLQNSVYFLLVVNASMFFICATTLAWGGWQMTFRRVPEAISTVVPVLGIITFLILMVIVFGGNHTIYHWTDEHHVMEDETLLHKKGFLNKTFFTVWSIITIGGWWFLGRKLRQLSRQSDAAPMSIEEGKRYIFKNTVWAGAYAALFGLTALSTTPWLWLMSIDAHWYSTMYSWYTFASSWVAGLALITIFVVYLKNNGYLEYTNREHLHDMGKFMFAFSIFWTYLWYSQFMLIWYANIPEETVYFKPRMQGVYRGIFLLNLVINFLAPLLILMKRGAKRNYGTITIMAVLIIFGHWLDFYQMVFPSISGDHVPFMLVDMGIGIGFVGIIMYVTARSLAKHPLVAKNHPFLKESIIHHT